VTELKSAADIEQWLLVRLNERLDGEQVDSHMPFSFYGLDSMDAFELTAELEEWLGRPIPETLTFDYPTVSAVATYLAAEPVAAETGDADAQASSAAAVQALLAELETPAHDRVPPQT
jgi:acyl carrier protein